MTKIEGRTDLETYIANAPCGDAQTATEVRAIADALIALDHPRYGSDWADWLDEHYETTALTVLCRPDAAALAIELGQIVGSDGSDELRVTVDHAIRAGKYDMQTLVEIVREARADAKIERERERVVRDYDTGGELEGAPSAALCAASDEGADAHGTGAVGAYRDRSGIWQYVREDEMSGAPGARTVFVEPA